MAAALSVRCGAALLAAALIAAPPSRAAESPAPAFDVVQAAAAVALLADAPSHGLEAADYGVAALQRLLPQRERLPEAAAQLDRALTPALTRYLHELHHGRVAPASTGHDRFDAAATLRAALAAQDLPLAVAQAAPALPQYQRLREALARYRVLASNAAWQAALPPLPRTGTRSTALQAGQAWAGVPLLAARLAALGDLDTLDAQPAPLYDDALVAALTRFQQRHGLDADGVIGHATWAALQVAPAQRVRQLELALERLRSTPLLQGPRTVLINIPEFVLRAYEVRDGAVAVRLESKVIVGKALDTRTPLISEPMRRVEFNPYWNVPASIARGELVPRLRRDPAYWEREGFEFVPTGGGPADAVLSGDKLQAVLAGALRIRQRPGARNALGSVKFVFPNRESIYLHDTPTAPLFARARRDFSHGCIRVEQPLALALFALQSRPEWTEARIREAMARGQPQAVSLAQPLPVLIAYGTALVKGGRVHFFDDLYGHDRRLDAALRRRTSSGSDATRDAAPEGRAP